MVAWSVGSPAAKNNGKARIRIFAYWKEVKMPPKKYKATLALTVEAEDEDGARQALKDQVGAADFDQSQIELEEVEE